MKRAKRLMGDMRADAELAGGQEQGGATRGVGDGRTKRGGESKLRVNAGKRVGAVGLRARGRHESGGVAVEHSGEKGSNRQLCLDDTKEGAARSDGGSGSASDEAEVSTPEVDATVLLLLRVRVSCPQGFRCGLQAIPCMSYPALWLV